MNSNTNENLRAVIAQISQTSMKYMSLLYHAHRSLEYGVNRDFGEKIQDYMLEFDDNLIDLDNTLGVISTKINELSAVTQEQPQEVDGESEVVSSSKDPYKRAKR